MFLFFPETSLLFKDLKPELMNLGAEPHLVGFNL